MRRVNVPVLLVQGQSDTLFNLNDATATYRALHRRHVPVGMIWNSGGHGGYSSQPGECEAYDGRDRPVMYRAALGAFGMAAEEGHEVAGVLGQRPLGRYPGGRTGPATGGCRGFMAVKTTDQVLKNSNR